MVFFTAFVVFFAPMLASAAVDPATRTWLRSAGNDPWVVMARATVGEMPGMPDAGNADIFGLSKTILAWTAGGSDPRAANGQDLVALFTRNFVSGGQIGNPSYVNDDFWGALALRSAGVSVDDAVLVSVRSFILRAQGANGGWSWDTSGRSPDTDDTAAAIMALRALGVSTNDASMTRAIAFLRSTQRSDGAFPNMPGGASSIESTAWVASALVAVGENPAAWKKRNDANPLTYLSSHMRADGTWGSPAATASAAIALAGRAHPLRIVTPAPVVVVAPIVIAPTPAPMVISVPVVHAPIPAIVPSPVLPSRIATSVSAPQQERIAPSTISIPLPVASTTCGRTVSPTTRSAYGTPRLARPSFETCWSQQLRGSVETMTGGALRVSAEKWNRLVAAYLYGGYDAQDIAMAVRGAKNINWVIPKAALRSRR